MYDPIVIAGAFRKFYDVNTNRFIDAPVRLRLCVTILTCFCRYFSSLGVDTTPSAHHILSQFESIEKMASVYCL